MRVCQFRHLGMGYARGPESPKGGPARRVDFKNRGCHATLSSGGNARGQLGWRSRPG